MNTEDYERNVRTQLNNCKKFDGVVIGKRRAECEKTRGYKTFTLSNDGLVVFQNATVIRAAHYLVTGDLS